MNMSRISFRKGGKYIFFATEKTLAFIIKKIFGFSEDSSLILGPRSFRNKSRLQCRSNHLTPVNICNCQASEVSKIIFL